jgi:[acyl-carrier-protein] S-malonyltransferase
MMNKLGLVFSGQGSQYVGMGLDFIELNPLLKEKELLASKRLGYDVRDVLTSTDGRLNETRYTQPMILLSTIFAFETFKSLNVQVEAVAGFSLGEYSAFYASEIFSFEQIIQLIDQRSRFMQECALQHPGKMAAILGLPSIEVEMICKEASSEGLVLCANYNSPVQTVISGEDKAVMKAIELSKQKGAKRAVELNVSGAFHSPLMKDAGDQLYQYVKMIPYQNPIYPIYLNTTAEPLDISDLYQGMKKQIQSPVYFEQTINNMKQKGISHFIEIGPGTVLSGLIKKIDINIEVTNLNKATDLEFLKGWLTTYGFIK